MYKKKVLITFFLLLIANTEWIFISLNYNVFAKLIEIDREIIINNQHAYLDSLTQVEDIYLRGDDRVSMNSASEKAIEQIIKTKEKTGEVSIENIRGIKSSTGAIISTKLLSPKKTVLDIFHEKYKGFKPNIIKVPAMGIESPVYNTSRNIEKLLDKGVVNYTKNKKGFYIFGHSSSNVESKFSNIFTRVTKLKQGDLVFLENNREVRVYKYKKYTYKKPESLKTLLDDSNRLYLITCYPFNTSITRYVAEFEYERTISKMEK